MSIDFYGIKGFGHMGSVKQKSDRGEMKETEASSGSNNSFFAALDHVSRTRSPMTPERVKESPRSMPSSNRLLWEHTNRIWTKLRQVF
ncbi:MAG: hypothetical protein OEV64_13740 [Desulfobulbaceae bacterium]|nr:hypothetical protein [Desulfobulbaceae bacterium]